MSPKKSTTSPEAQAEEVLRGGKRARAQDLVSLIHEINPTGRELAAEADRRRYALKSKLQSLLVRTFPDEVSVEPVGESGVVGLRYRPQDRDACHAVIADLDEDARSWVRLALDLAETRPAETRAVARAGDRRKAPKPRAPDHAGADPETLLRLGGEALEAYDFERARDCFEQAVEDSDGDTAAATALLEFLIDHLAAYDDAFGCQDRLSPEALRDPTVRSLIAGAAAHLGHVDKCISLLDGVEGRRAADTWVVLAKTALASGDLIRTDKNIEQARKLAPSHADVIPLVEEIRRKRAIARRPAEAELEQLAAAGDDAATEHKVREILAQWPDSSTARSVLRELEAKQRTTQSEALSIQGKAAFEAKDFARAARSWSEARVLGTLDLDHRIAEATAAEAAVRRDERIAITVRTLSVEVSSAHLAKYQALSSNEREQVRAQLGIPALEWLEQLGLGHDEGDRDSGDVAAALALIEVNALNVSERADHVISLLEPFEPRLRRLLAGRELLSRARSSRDERRLRDARRSLESARRAFEAGSHETAVRLVEQLRMSLPIELKAEAELLEAEARKPLELQRRRDDFETLLQANRLVDALDVLREAELNSCSSEQTHWIRCRQDVAARLRRELKVQVHECATQAAAPECSIGTVRDDVVYGLDGSAETFYWVTTHGGELFIRVFVVGDKRIRTLVALRPPEPMDFPRAQVEGNSLWISAASGAVLELSIVDWNILRWRSSAGLHAAEEIVEQELLVPGTRFLWLSVRVRGAGSDEVLRVFDLERHRLQREMTGGARLTLVPSPNGPKVFAGGFRREGRIYSPSGTSIHSIPASIGEVACVPDQTAYFGYARTGDDDAEVLQLVLIDGEGRRTAAAELPDSWADSSHALATSHRAQLTFALYEGADRRLAAFEVREGAPAEVWQIEPPAGACLVQDVLGQHVALLYPSNVGPAIEVLGRLPPPVTTEREELDRAIPRISDNDYCGTPPADEGIEIVARAIKDKPSAVARSREMDRVLESRGNDPMALVQLASALRGWRVEVEANRASSVARSSFAEHHWVRLDDAAEAARNHDWGRVLDKLGDLHARFEDRKRAHVHHLRGLALYHLNRFDEARLEFDQCASVPDGPCRVEGWTDWLRFLERPLDGAMSDEASSAFRLLGAIRNADRFLEAGDGHRAQEQLDTRLGWRWLEIQTAARLAEAMLLQPESIGERHFRKRLVLAAFVEALDEKMKFRGSLPLGPWTWPEEKVAAVGLRARDWLDSPSDRR